MIQAVYALAERIKARSGDAKSTLSTGMAPVELVKTGQPSAKVNQMLGLVQRALRVEAGQSGAGDGVSDTITAKLFATDIALWQDETTLFALMKDIWRRSLQDIMGETGADMIISNSDNTSVLMEVEQLLAKAEEDLQARQQASDDETQEAEGEEQAYQAADPEKEVQ